MASERAVASCGFLAPRLEPTFIRLVAFKGTNPKPVAALLLHVRPQARSAGKEVAVYAVEVPHIGGGDLLRVNESGAVYALPPHPEGLESFARDILSTTPLAGHGVGVSLCLPKVLRTGSKCWSKVHVGLYSPKDVSIDPTSGDSNTVQMAFEHLEEGSEALALLEVDSEASEFTTAHSAPLAATAGEYSHVAYDKLPPVVHEVYTRLRDSDMQRLVEALAAILRQALRYRGMAPPPQPRKRRRVDDGSVVGSDGGAAQ